MPVWLSLLLAIGAGAGTYFLTPKITRTIELDKARSAHIAIAINRVNDDVVGLAKAIRQFIAAFIDDPEKITTLRGNCLDHITEGQWRIIDLKVILSNENDRQCLDRLGEQFAQLRTMVVELDQNQGHGGLVLKVGEVTTSMKQILHSLYDASKLRKHKDIAGR